MNRSQQIQQLTDASARLTGVIDRLRGQEAGQSSGTTRPAHSSESVAGSQSSQKQQFTDREILAQISQEVQEVSNNLSQ